MSGKIVRTPPSAEAALTLIQDFLKLAADQRDAPAARLLMSTDSTRVAAFDPIGLAGKDYAIGEPFPTEDSVIIPVGFGDDTGLQASAPLVVILENGVPRLDVKATVEMMMGGQIRYVDSDGIVDEEDDERDENEGGASEEKTAPPI